MIGFDGLRNRSRIKEHWNACSDEYFQKRDTGSIMDKLRGNPAAVFHREVFRDVREVMKETRVPRIGVLGSGDNQAVYAFHLLGAEVTSVDISEGQIRNAKAIAKDHGLSISFVTSDILNLNSIPDSRFDMVYTSNGVLTWIDDLSRMFGEVCRILKDGGAYILYDVHPSQRPWDAVPKSQRLGSPMTTSDLCRTHAMEMPEPFTGGSKTSSTH